MAPLIYCCPNCEAVVYDRTKDRCAVCGAPLPEQSFITPAEADSMSREDDEAEAGRKRDCGNQELREQRREGTAQKF